MRRLLAAAAVMACAMACGATPASAREASRADAQEAAQGEEAAGGLDYAYFTLQGRLTDPSLRRALQGATIRLASADREFETITDSRGLFVFEKLPVTSFTVTVISAEGQVVKEVRRLDAGDPYRQRLRVKLGRGPAASFEVNAAEDAITLDVPQPEVRWDRFWRELAIFAGGAALLAL